MKNKSLIIFSLFLIILFFLFCNKKSENQPTEIGEVTTTTFSSATTVSTTTTSGGGGTTITAPNCNITTTAGTTTTIDHLTVYFKKPDTWTTPVNIYFWPISPAVTPATASWPGVNMTTVSDGWYKYDFATGITKANIIFTDKNTGTNQTGDLNRVDKNGWYKNNQWSDSTFIFLLYIRQVGKV